MQDASAGPKSGEGMWLWLAKILTGLLVIFILVIHFIVNHLSATGLLTWADVVKYYATNPIIPAMEIIFLIFVVSHSLLGLRSIILDLHPARAILKGIDWLFCLFGIFAISYGIWLIFAIIAQYKPL